MLTKHPPATYFAKLGLYQHYDRLSQPESLRYQNGKRVLSLTIEVIFERVFALLAGKPVSLQGKRPPNKLLPARLCLPVTCVLMNRKEFFVYLIWETDRLRFRIDIEQGGVIDFVAQYETLLNSKWTAIVRYDFAHGFFHRDLMNPDGEQEKRLSTFKTGRKR